MLSSRFPPALHRSISRASLLRYRVSNGTRSEYHSKVAAYPFTLSPTAAIENFAHFPLTPHILNSFNPMKLGEYFSKSGLDIPRATAEHALKPDKFSAVYFPAWFVYAALRAEESGFGLLFNRAYYPGYKHHILSHTSFNIQPQILEHELDDPQPWTESLRVQHDKDVLCLPYRTAPLYNGSEFDWMSRWFNATRLDVEFLAAHPVLIPLYLAEYHDVITQEPMTVVIEAHTSRMYCTRLLKDATSVMMKEFSSTSRIASWVGSWLVKFADDFDRQRNRSSAGDLLLFSGRDAYPDIHSLVKAEIPKSGEEGIPAQILPSPAVRLPGMHWHTMDDGTHQGLDDLRVRPFTRQAGRESNDCAQYAIGSSLLAQETSPSAQALRKEMESSLEKAAPWWLEWKASHQSSENS
ncbi:hypothetical protein PENSPDRAFT_234714 [Peniophora sp. CONT]|nr:hypothetical protein PENSPDRAFT_234714 [Peniophora sp. CONT]